ncbi:MAG: DUF393 domain-containing protein [Ignavibacteriae bacterium]|nr:MAG: DUF393 domain-containing protein [Ignavibacteriota bacterium]
MSNLSKYPVSRSIVLFDGVCVLCSRFVQFVIEHDKHHEFRFDALQSDHGRLLPDRIPSGDTGFTTIILIHAGQTYTMSDAVLRIFKNLGGAWRMISFLVIVPKPIRDGFYRIISRYRYRVFGKKDLCPVSVKGLDRTVS